MIGKFYAISNEAAIRKGTLISTVFAIIVAGGCYFLGGFGRIFVSPEQVAEKGFDSIVPTMLAELSPYIIGVVIGSVFGIITVDHHFQDFWYDYEFFCQEGLGRGSAPCSIHPGGGYRPYGLFDSGPKRHFG